MLHKGTLQYGIVLEKNENIGLNGFSDVDQEGDVDGRKSTTGYAFNLGSEVISSASKKQTSGTLSSIEAQYKTTVGANCGSMRQHGYIGFSVI